MTLRRKMIYQIGAMIVGLVLLSIAPLWGLNGLHQDFGLALRGYEQLRGIYEVGTHVAAARAAIKAEIPNPDGALAEVSVARAKLEELFSPHPGGAAAAPVRILMPDGQEGTAALKAGLKAASAALRASSGREALVGEHAAQVDAVERVLGQLRYLAIEIQKTIRQKEEAADARRRATMTAVACLAAAVVLGAIVLGAVQYRSVINPLRRLADSVRQIAAGSFANRVQIAGSAEFVALAEDFNRMARELDGLYRDLEQKVADKSKELVRSERLASVGYLAAGVAHEINNPLGIIAGYGERSLELLDREPNEANDAALRKSIQVICGEAFRCKEITDKLLSLARPGDEDRRPVDLADVARRVASIVGDLPAYRDCKLTLRIDPPDLPAVLTVLAREAEMQQVLLNLALNALEAIHGVNGGQVGVAVARNEGLVELSVSDNGRGMSASTLERVFEPFYTEKRGDRPGGRPGTGLGLSITHAIVAAHGGRIRAESAGAGKGSKFVVEFPAVADRTQM